MSSSAGLSGLCVYSLQVRLGTCPGRIGLGAGLLHLMYVACAVLLFLYITHLVSVSSSSFGTCENSHLIAHAQ